MENEPKKTKKQLSGREAKKWIEEIYAQWYERNKPGGVNASSNPTDPPPPPPGPIKP